MTELLGSEWTCGVFGIYRCRSGGDREGRLYRTPIISRGAFKGATGGGKYGETPHYNRCCRVREVVNDGYNGFLVPVKDAKSLSQAMERMIALTSRERDIMGKRGRLKVISEFDDRIIIKDYLDTINSHFESPSLSKASNAFKG